MKNIVNIINFVRAVEPRPGRKIDLKEPVREQIRLLKEHNLRGTFLLQYDALLDEEFIELMHTCTEFAEVGLWFEIVQPLVEKIGEKWNGRYPWDWYNDVGFLIGYEPKIRQSLIDECMAKFKEIFGRYPDCIGSWHIDAVSLKYLSEKYNVSACCICRDQIGIDGYTMHGSYFNQAYYPSVNNMFCPANSKENQISLPVFRMLGADPIHDYDSQIQPDLCKLGVPTLEPASENYGGNEDWCNWFFNENFNGSGISFQYTQSGQENSFGWPRMKKGIEYQFSLIKKLSDSGKIDVMTLSDSGKWYKSQFELTPAAAQAAMSEARNLNRKSIWYNSRFYRTNLYFNDGIVRLRDFYIFGDSLKERYLEKRCDTHACEYRNLPVMDGVLYTNPGSGDFAGIYFTANGKNIRWDNLEYREEQSNAIVTLSGDAGKLIVTLSEKSVEFATDIENFALTPHFDRDYVYGKNTDSDTNFGNHNNRSVVLSFISDASVTENKLSLEFNGVKYGLDVKSGMFSPDFSLHSNGGSIKAEVLTEIKE